MCESDHTVEDDTDTGINTHSYDLLMGAAQKINPCQKSFKIYEIKYVALINRQIVFPDI